MLLARTMRSRAALLVWCLALPLAAAEEEALARGRDAGLGRDAVLQRPDRVAVPLDAKIDTGKAPEVALDVERNRTLVRDDARAPPRRAEEKPSVSAAATWSGDRPATALAGRMPTRANEPACSASTVAATCTAPLPAAPSTETVSVRPSTSAAASMPTRVP